MTPGSCLKSANKRDRPNQHVTFKRIQPPNANDLSSVNLPPSTNPYELVDGDFGLSATVTNHYDEINDHQVAPSPQHVEYLTPISRLYNAPSPQDNEPPGIYSRPKPVAPPSEDHQTSGPYNNAPGQHEGYPDVGVMSEPKENMVTAVPGTNYTNVTIATENPYVVAMS